MGIKMVTKDFPRVASWIITTKCNMNCLHCYVPSGLETDELNLAQVKIVIDKLVYLGIKTLILSGGEPLLRKDILHICEYATLKGLYISICSNGSLLSKDLVQKLKKYNLFNITISLDSRDPGINDELRDYKGAFEAACRGIKICLENDIKIFIDATITRLNYYSIEEIIPFCSNLGVSLIMFRRFIPIGRGAENINKLFLPQEEYISSLDKCIKQNLFYPNVDIAFSDVAFRMFVLKNIFKPSYLGYASLKISKKIGDLLTLNLNKTVHTKEVFRMQYRNFGCPAGVNWIGIMPNGDLRACPILPITIGNAIAWDVGVDWHKKDIIYELERRNKLKGKCGKCFLKKFCGGCRAYVFSTQFDYLGEDSFCKI